MYAVSMLKNGRLFRKRKKLWQSLSVWPALFWNPTILPIRLTFISSQSFQKPSLRFLPRLSSGGSLLKRFVRASGLRPRGGIKKGRPGTFPEQPLIFFYFWPVVLPKPPFRISTASSSTVMPYSTKIPCIKPVPFSMQTTFPSLESLVSFAKIWPSLSE